MFEEVRILNLYSMMQPNRYLSMKSLETLISAIRVDNMDILQINVLQRLRWYGIEKIQKVRVKMNGDVITVIRPLIV